MYAKCFFYLLINSDLNYLYIRTVPISISKLFDTCADELVMSAYYYLRDKDLSKDMVADCFEKLIIAERKGLMDLTEKTENDVRSWLFAILKNRCLDEIKQKKNRGRLLSMFNFNTISRNQWFDKAESESFEITLKLLPTKEAEVFRLHVQGYSNAEISDKMQVTYSTVKNQLYEAKKKMKLFWEFMILIFVPLL